MDIIFRVAPYFKEERAIKKASERRQRIQKQTLSDLIVAYRYSRSISHAEI
jgi:hypothetical protein